MRTENVIFDNIHLEGFLTIAFQEKLLEVDHRKTDNVFKRYFETKISETLKDSILEQITLSPKIIINTKRVSGLWEYLKGPLIDDQIINFESFELKLDGDPKYLLNQPVEKVGDILRANFPFAVILEMLNQKTSKAYSEPEIDKILQEAASALKEEKTIYQDQGREIPPVASFSHQLYKALNPVLGLKNPLADYSKEEIQGQRKRNSIYKVAEPVFSTIADFIHLTNESNTFNSLLKLSIPNKLNNNNNSVLNSSGNAIGIFQFISDELNVHSHRGNLNDSIKLSKDNSSEELRKMINFWLERINVFDEKGIKELSKEISKAQEALNMSKTFKKKQSLCATIGWPLMAISLGLALGGTSVPIMIKVLTGITGMQVKFLGEVYKYSSQSIDKGFDWINFGRTIK